MNESISIQKFNSYLVENNIWWSPERLDYSLGLLFRNLPLLGRVVLDVGAGNGLFSVWCAAHGAARVVALEPEASGSTRGVGQQFEKLAQAIDLVGKVDYIKVTLQEYMKDYKLQMFDYVLLHAVINHLDEAATERLHLPDSQAERQRYKNIFRGLYNILNTNGTILIYDVGRRNFWNDFKLKSPFVSTIEYQKHQQPAVWKSLLCESGFEPLDINWFTPFKLRKIRQLLSWWLPIYFINSSFILRMRKPAAYNTPGKTRINLTQSR